MIKRTNSLIILNLLFFILVSISPGQEKAAYSKLDTIAVIDNKAITLKDYEDFFYKNNSGIQPGSKISDEKKSEFLDLLIRYKLKIKAGINSGMLDDPGIKKEIFDYRKNLATSIIKNKEIIEPNLRLFYERRKVNLKIAAIMLKTDLADPADTSTKYTLAKSIIESLNKGANFAELARKYSVLNYQNPDDAVIGFISAGQTVSPEFENAIYNLSQGKITQNPVKMPQGYIIAKLLDIERRTGGRKYAHILLQFKKNSKADSLEVIREAEKITDKLKNGESFESLAAKYSDDKTTKNNGGIIGIFERDAVWNNPGESLKAGFSIQFLNTAFALNPAEVSSPVQDQQGLHIIKYVESIEYPSFDSVRELLKEEYISLRYEKDFRYFIEKTKSDIKLKKYDAVLDKVFSLLDKNKNTNYSDWDEPLDSLMRKNVVFSFIPGQKTEKAITVAEMVRIIDNNEEFRGIEFSSEGLKNIIGKLSDFAAMNYLISRINIDYPGFENEIQTYIDELISFHFNSTFIWNKIVMSDSALKEFYKKHIELFRILPGVSLTEIFVQDDSTTEAIYKQVNNNPGKEKNTGKNKKLKVKISDYSDFENLASKYTIRKNFKEKKGLWNLTENENNLAIKAKGLPVGGISKPFAFEDGYSIIRVNSKQPAYQKKYEECTSEVSEKYREFESRRIEDKMIDSLKKKYSVKIFHEKIKSALTSF